MWRVPNRTEYVLAAIPLGGYVKLLDEREAPVDPAEVSRAFNRRPHWQRIVVLFAGPAFNVIFAVLLLAVLFWVNGLTQVRAMVGDVLPDSPASRAGLASGDEILRMDGVTVNDQSDAVMGLLEQMTGDGRVALVVRSAAGQTREAVLDVPDSREPGARLTEPENLLHGLGFGFCAPPLPAVVGSVTPGGPAAQAGVQAGDEILAVNGTAVASFENCSGATLEHAGDNVLLAIRRAGADVTARVEVQAVDERRRSAASGIGSGCSTSRQPIRLRWCVIRK